MFELVNEKEPGNDYWCIVAAKIDSNGDGTVIILKESEDAAYHCLFEDMPYAEDCGLSMDWWKDGMADGVYWLRVHPWTHQGYDGDYDTGIDVREFKLMCELKV